MAHTVNDVVRMTGQLLLHHGGTGFYYDDLHNTFCFVGARWGSCGALGMRDRRSTVGKAVKNVLGRDIDESQWDSMSDMERHDVATQLANVTDP